MVQPQMDWDQFRNVSNLVLVEPNQIRDSFNNVRKSPDAVSNITCFLSVADVKCGLYETNKNNTANATHGLNPVQKMFRD